MRFPVLAVLAVALALPWGRSAADSAHPAGARLWTEGALQSLSRALEKSGAPYTQVVNGKTYGLLLLRRTASGSPELHAKLNDFFVVLSGRGAVRVGGTVSGEKTVAPNEERGETLTGGTLYRVARGDVLFVPANHWLQVLVTRGEVLRAIIIKTQ